MHVTGAGNDYQKELQFKKLNAQKDVIEVKVIRSGEEQLVTNSDVVVVGCTEAALLLQELCLLPCIICLLPNAVCTTALLTAQGDLLVLDTGDKVVADGLLVLGHGLVVDEASLTGESDPQSKNPAKPWLRSGTQVRMGSVAPLPCTPCTMPCRDNSWPLRAGRRRRWTHAGDRCR